MIAKVKVEKTCPQITEVKTCWDEAETNALLKTGEWGLLHGGIAHNDMMGYQAKPCWVLGRLKGKAA